MEKKVCPKCGSEYNGGECQECGYPNAHATKKESKPKGGDNGGHKGGGGKGSGSK